MRRRLPLQLVLATVVMAAGPTARGAEITDVASAFDPDNSFDFRLRVGYQHLEKRAAIQREMELPGQDQIGLYKDLLHSQSRDSLHLRMEISIFRDLMIYADFPIVLNDARSMRFDQRLAGSCVYPGTSSLPPTCVNAANSSTVRDGILPNNPDGSYGFNAATAGSFQSPSDLVFQGPKRSGIDTLNLGIMWAALSQKRDDTKPTWTIGFEGHISLGTIMAFDRSRPDANKGVSDGLHKLVFQTTVSKRFRFFDPYAGFWYMLPLARTGLDSPWIDYGPTQKSKDPQMAGGTVFGIEAVPWEKPSDNYKVGIQAQIRIEGRFEGRGYSEAWEMLASSPALACDAKWNPACDTAQVSNRYQNVAYTGLTQIQDYARLGADIGLLVQAGKYARFFAGFQYTHDQSHFLTEDGVGKVLNTPVCPAMSERVQQACEFNPAYRPQINQIGRRYKVADVNLYNVGVWGQVMF